VAAQRRAHPGEQLAHPERFGDVVVRASVERGDLVGLLTADRQDDDRDLGPSAQSLDHAESVDAR